MGAVRLRRCALAIDRDGVHRGGGAGEARREDEARKQQQQEEDEGRRKWERRLRKVDARGQRGMGDKP